MSLKELIEAAAIQVDLQKPTVGPRIETGLTIGDLLHRVMDDMFVGPRLVK